MSQSEIIFLVQESPEGGYQARALGFSILTEADSLDELKTMIRDAVSCHFDPSNKPSIIRLVVTYYFEPERLSAAGYAEYHPVDSNDTSEGRATGAWTS